MEAEAYLHQLILHNFSPSVLGIDGDELGDTDKQALFNKLKLTWNKCLTDKLRRVVLQQVLELAKKYPRDQVFDVFATSFNSAATKETEPVESVRELFFGEQIPYPENPHYLPVGLDFKRPERDIDEVAKQEMHKSLVPLLDDLRELVRQARNYDFACFEEGLIIDQLNLNILLSLRKARNLRTKIEDVSLGRWGKQKKENQRKRLLDLYDEIEKEFIIPQIVGIVEINYSKSLLLPQAA
jgi:hypothetical protein